jgi:hypothetical protein
MYVGRKINVLGCSKKVLCADCSGVCQGVKHGKIVGTITRENSRLAWVGLTAINIDVVEDFFNNSKFTKHKERLLADGLPSSTV